VEKDEKAFKWFEYNTLEGLIKSSFGSTDALLKKMDRTPAWYYRARTNKSLRIRDLETICDLIGMHPREMFTASTAHNIAVDQLTQYGGAAAISQRIGEVCHVLSKSQKEFAEKTGINPTHLSYVISQGGEPGLLTVTRVLFSYPNVSARWLLFGTGTMFSDDETTETLKRSLADKEEIISLLKRQIDG